MYTCREGFKSSSRAYTNCLAITMSKYFKQIIMYKYNFNPHFYIHAYLPQFHFRKGTNFMYNYLMNMLLTNCG